MNGFNGRGVLDRIPNGGTSLHSQVDFISNSLEWITKEMVSEVPWEWISTLYDTAVFMLVCLRKEARRIFTL